VYTLFFGRIHFSEEKYNYIVCESIRFWQVTLGSIITMPCQFVGTSRDVCFREYFLEIVNLIYSYYLWVFCSVGTSLGLFKATLKISFSADMYV
jgi:hypothetical protein